MMLAKAFQLAEYQARASAQCVHATGSKIKNPNPKHWFSTIDLVGHKPLPSLGEGRELACEVNIIIEFVKNLERNTMKDTRDMG
ncbi:hypothetical protein POTOM_039738 [Populus tomentosa]|uniref:Uncharacterized protein n=1 Tax=Populus tomentosa TaxID=118781 RepID=A0A8X7YSJ1_POPTO|nr:hypothetical protein POTOM_039738 [Populus tomentosa]